LYLYCVSASGFARLDNPKIMVMHANGSTSSLGSDTSLPALIAHYLASNYPSVLEPFVQAARIPRPDPARPPKPDLRTLVEDYLSHRLVAELGHVAIDEDTEVKSKDIVKLDLAPGVRLGGLRRSIEGTTAANLLTVGVERLPHRRFDTSSAE
jgi:hypothetical protein